MKGSYSSSLGAHPYIIGEPIFEADRLAALSLRPMSADSESDEDDYEIFFVTDFLRSMKFDEWEIRGIIDGVRSTMKTISGILSIVGTVSSVIDIMNKLEIFGPQEDAVQAKLDEIGQKVGQMYQYLVNAELKGLQLQAVVWRSKMSGSRLAMKDAQISPTQLQLQTLVDRNAELDESLRLMLDPNMAKISFLRQVYRYPSADGSRHWVDAAVPPFMNTTGGAPVDYADTELDLKTQIWDAGHYIDVLFASLSQRMVSTVIIEPAFRSTGYNRALFQEVAENLTKFIHAWRSSILVANPDVGLNGNFPSYFGETIPAPGAGILQSPYWPNARFVGSQSAPHGIVLGAVDPVSGIVAWDSEWAGFATVKSVSLIDLGFVKEAWGGGFDLVRAKDPVQALAAARKRQVELLDGVISTSGIDALVKLRAQFQFAASEVVGSEFVQLPNAQFRLVKTGIHIDGSPIFALRQGAVEWVDLGRMAPFAADPQKQYEGTRYYQDTVKTFRFRMAQRTSRTRIQLGYRLRVGSTDIPLVPFSRGGFLDENTVAFPTAAIQREVREEMRVYTVRQSHVFSFAEENLFEAGEPIPGNTSPWAIPAWSGRLFQDERMGKVALAVEVRFEHDPTGQHYTGEAIVTIRNLGPENFPDGAIVPIQVFETHMDGSDVPEPKEYLADSMTVHIVPSFVVMERDYFTDYGKTSDFIEKTVQDISERFQGQVQIPRGPGPNPAWAVRRRLLETVAVVDTIDAIRVSQPEILADVMQQFRPPAAVQTTTTILRTSDTLESSALSE